MSDQLNPPSEASRLLSWIRDPHLPQILGDLDEEYVERARSLGAAAARRWYWRETLRNAGVLLWRKRIIGTTVIAMVALVSVNVVFGTLSEFTYRIWMRLTMPATLYRPLAFRLGWGVIWPAHAGGLARYLVLSLLAGFSAGYLFAVALPARAKALRVAAVVLWAINIAWYNIWLFGGAHSFSRFLVPGVASNRWRHVWFEFVLTQAVAAGAFFVGAGAGMARRKTVPTR